MSWFTNLRDKITSFFQTTVAKVEAKIPTNVVAAPVAPIVVATPVQQTPDTVVANVQSKQGETMTVSDPLNSGVQVPVKPVLDFYTGIPLLCVISSVAPTQAGRTKAEQALEAQAGGQAQASGYHATYDNADPAFTSAVRQVMSGIDAAVAFHNVSRPGQSPHGVNFTEVQLAAAQLVANAYL